MVSTRQQRASRRSPDASENGGEGEERRRGPRVRRVRITRVRFFVPFLEGHDEGARETAAEDLPTVIPNETESDSDEDTIGTTERATQARRLPRESVQRMPPAFGDGDVPSGSAQDPNDGDRNENAVDRETPAGEHTLPQGLVSGPVPDPNDRIQDAVDRPIERQPLDQAAQARTVDAQEHPQQDLVAEQAQVLQDPANDVPVEDLASDSPAQVPAGQSEPEAQDPVAGESQSPAAAQAARMMGVPQPQAGVLVVPSVRMTRSMMKSRIHDVAQARERSREDVGGKGRSQALLEEIYAELTAELEKENEAALGGALSGSDDGDESEYEATQVAKTSAKASESSEADEPPLKVASTRKRPSATKTTARVSPKAKQERARLPKVVPKGNGKAKRKRKPSDSPSDYSDSSGSDDPDDPDVSRRNSGKRARVGKGVEKGMGNLKRDRLPHDSDDPVVAPPAKRARVQLFGDHELSHRTNASVPDGENEEDVPNASVADDEDKEDVSTDELEIPLHLLDVRDRGGSAGGFAHGLKQQFGSWDEFHDEFDAFMAAHFQLFKRRISTTVVNRNGQITNPLLKIPESFVKYAQTLLCTHALTRQLSKKEKDAKPKKRNPDGTQESTSVEPRRFHRYTGWKATVNATVKRVRQGNTDDCFAIVWRAKSCHNHAVSCEIYQYYVEIRLPKTPELLLEVDRLMRTGADSICMLNTFRADTGRPILMQDIRDVIQKVKRERIAATTVAEHLEKHLQSFVSVPGNWATVYVDKDTSEARSVTFQSARMRKLFAAAPEVIMVDCTFGTNKSQYTLFSFVVHDLFGKGQYVFHSLLHRETMDNMEDSIVAFIKANPKAADVRAFIVDKDFKERTLLKRHFPKARILLCHYHVIKIFAKKIKQLIRGTKTEKDDLIGIMRALVYAKSPAVYDALKLYLAKALSNMMDPDDDQTDDDKPHEVHDEEDLLSDDAREDEVGFFDDAEVTEISSTAVRDARYDEDVARGKSHRFSRTSSTIGKVFKTSGIEAKFGAIKRVRTSNMDLEETIRAIREMQAVNEDVYIEALIKPGTRHTHTGDHELDQLLNIVSDHAYVLVLEEYRAVKDRVVNYSVRESNGNAVLKSTAPWNGEYHDEHTVHISAFTDIIPFKTINLRWSVRNPANNILSCDFPPGQYRTKLTAPKPTNQLTERDRFCKIMAIMKEIAGVVSRKPPAVFDKWVRSFQHIRDRRGDTLIPLLMDDDSESASQEHDDGDEEDNRATQASQDQDQDNTEDVHRDQENTEDVHSETEHTSFSIPAAVRMRFARNKESVSARQKLMEKIKREAATFMHRESIPRTNSSLADVQAVIENQSYCYSDAMPLICTIPIERATTDAELRRKLPEHVVADSTAIRFVLEQAQLERIRHDLDEIEVESGEYATGNYEGYVVIAGDGKGCLSVSQLRTMETFHEALDCIHTVITSGHWLKDIKAKRGLELPHPFDEISDTFDEDYITHAVQAIGMMPLGIVRSTYDVTNGHTLLEIASNGWLSTTSINAIMYSVTSVHPEVGVVKAEYFTIKNDDMRERTLQATSPFGKEYSRIVSIVNISGVHWQAFHVDLAAGVCILYDPASELMGSVHRLKKEVEKLMEKYAPNKTIEYRMFHQDFGTLKQPDNDSCGVFCCIAMEIMLHCLKWDPKFVLPSDVYRARYMTIMAVMQRKLSEM